jgi:hypothetical protein
MTVGPTQLTRSNPYAWRTAAAGLILAAAIVGVAIGLSGSGAQVLNGIGALVWLASGAYLALSLPRPERRTLGWLAAIVGALALGAVVRPSGLLEATVWFAIAGAAAVLLAGDRSGAWALLVPAIYLPVHLLIGIGRAILLNHGMRVEPPPTAALLPLVMVLAAVVAGALATMLVRRER